MVSLCHICEITQFHNIKPIILGWLDVWDAARYVTLVKKGEEANLDSGGGGCGRSMGIQCQDNYTSHVHKYNKMVLVGKVYMAI